MSQRIYLYTRVSTDQQTHDSQLGELRDYCQRRNWDIVEAITDTASGGQFSRQGLDRLMGLVRRGKVDTIVVFRLDRLARSLSHLAQLLGELQAHRTALVCPGQGIDTTQSNPAAQLQINILGAVAQFEKELIVERINAGLKVAKANGVKLGRPSKYEHLMPQIRSLVRQGKTVAAIGRELGIPASTARDLVFKTFE